MKEPAGLKHGMAVQVSTDSGDHYLAVRGLGAGWILEREAGAHIWEQPDESRDDTRRALDRVSVEVAVTPWPAAAPNGSSVSDLIRATFAGTAAHRRVVRRYRSEPAPLVRDAVRQYRTGNLDDVFAGDFDVMA